MKLNRSDPMTNKIVKGELPSGSRIRIGVPGESPEEALSVLRTHFLSRPSVMSARLGLMEVVGDEIQPGFFTYTIGLVCDRPEQWEVEADEAMKMIAPVPTGRWPISFFTLTQTHFTAEAVIFYQRQKQSAKPGFLGRLFGRSH